MNPEAQSPPVLNLIGPGRLGQTLARLWVDAGLVRMNCICGRSEASAIQARNFIGAGEPVDAPRLAAGGLTLVAVPDDQLAALVAQLLKSETMAPGSIVFHGSGARASDVLAPLRDLGARVASIHPLKSFARPALAILDFAGTYCGCEGDEDALARLQPLFAAVGGHCFPVDGAHKVRYHAGAVLACNALTALMEAALASMAAAGVARGQAWPALRPLIQGTLDNIDRLGTTAALTGPVARGDGETVAHQLAALEQLDPNLAAVYRSLGVVALGMAAPVLDERRQAALVKVLKG